jgi:hypothetical protein
MSPGHGVHETGRRSALGPSSALAPLWALMLALVLALGCGGGTSGGPDGSSADGGGGMDASVGPIPCATDEDCPTYCNRGNMLCCAPANPPIEICGDRIDQNCDGRDTSCGDGDRDGIAACRPGEDPLSGSCDCDDDRADVRPPFGTLPGAMEFCDSVDNDCNGRVDEHAECCSGCDALGDARERADICTVDDVCDCSTEDALGACAEGSTCCSDGCVDTRTSVSHCGFCEARCTVSADRCADGECRCGDGPPCDLDAPCLGGVCQM